MSSSMGFLSSLTVIESGDISLTVLEPCWGYVTWRYLKSSYFTQMQWTFSNCCALKNYLSSTRTSYPTEGEHLIQQTLNVYLGNVVSLTWNPWLFPTCMVPRTWRHTDQLVIHSLKNSTWHLKFLGGHTWWQMVLRACLCAVVEPPEKYYKVNIKNFINLGWKHNTFESTT